MMLPGGPRVSETSVWRIALLVVMFAALALRLYGINWDEGADLHPDELFIAKIVLIDRIHFSWPPDISQLRDPARSGLNPRSADPATGQFREFAYGALPLFVTDFVAWILSRVTGTNWNAADHAFLVGRFLSAVLSALTILPVAALGSKLGGRRVGLLAALFAALAPMSIQLAHFFTTDSWLACFVALTLLACVQAAQYGGVWRFALAGAGVGLAMATKGSVFTLAIPAAVALICNTMNQGTRLRLQRIGRDAFAVAGSAVVAFFVFEPYAFLRPDIYLRDLRTQADIVSGRFDVPFTRVYAGTIPLLYQLEQFIRWGYGPVAGLLAIIGLGLLVTRACQNRSVPSLILVSWVVAYCSVLLFADAKFLRYLEPLAPVFAVAAAVALIHLPMVFAQSRWRNAARLATVSALALTAMWSVAFLSVYAHENPRVAATKWIYGMLPPGSSMTAEYWDDPLPRAMSYALNPATFGYSTMQLDLYRDLPPRQASAAIFSALRQADYVIQSSERVEAAIWAAPWRYPVQERFYDLLRRGRLAFDLVAAFTRAPTFGALTFDDRKADESFINYDHPRVSIYARHSALSRAAYNDAMAWALPRPWFPARQPPRPTLLLDRPVGENPAVDDARWSAAITASTPGALVAWLGLLVALAVVGAPLAQMLFNGFPDRGWGFARLLALVVAAYPVWLGVSLHLFAFRAIWVVASLLLVGLLGWRWHIQRVAPSAPLTMPSSSLWKHAEAAFWLVFAIFLALRLFNPDGWHPLWGGEKPMEFAQINAIGRSAYFPPYDPWFADGYINYYYYGFYLIAFMLKAIGIPAETGFNLAQPTIMALLASAVFSIAGAICRKLGLSPRLTIAGGWLALVLTCLMGNLSAARGLISADRGLFDPFLYWTWAGSRAIDNTITEFPYFTGLYADLHAHVVALPLTVLIVALCFALVIDGISRVRLAVLALTLGTLFVTNAWDVPLYAILSVAAISMASGNIDTVQRRVIVAATASVAVLAGAWLLFLPFHRTYVALFSSFALVHDPTDLSQFLIHLGGLLVICSFGLTALVMPRRLALAPIEILPVAAVVLFGIVLVIRTGVDHGQSTVALLCGFALAGAPLATVWRRISEGMRRDSQIVIAAKAVTIAGAISAVASVALGRSVLGLTLGLGCASVAAWLVSRSPAKRFLCVLLAGGFFVAAGAEIVVIADDLIDTAAYRMNTVFKFYNQVWILLSVSAACLLVVMAKNMVIGLSPRTRTMSARTIWSSVGIAVSLLMIVGGLLYPLLATGPRLAQRFNPGTVVGNLDALQWMDHGSVPTLAADLDGRITFRGDLAAIRWLQNNIKGSPVIAEASIGPYRCNGSRIANATGLPTIIGWERHEQQQRYPEDLPERVNDVRMLYMSTDPAAKAAILSRYNVEYVIVGDLERAYPNPDNDCTPAGSAAGIAAFERMVGSTLEVAHAEDGTTIYHVLTSGSDR